MADILKQFTKNLQKMDEAKRYKTAAEIMAEDFYKRMARMRTLLMTANRYVEGYAENENNHPQARDGARDLIRQIKEAI